MRLFLKLLLGLLIVLVVAALGLMALGSFRARATRGAWAETLGSDEDFRKRYPERRANEAVRELERLAAPLGIGLAPRDQPGRAIPSEAEQKRLEAFATDKLMPFLDLSRRDDAVEAPPPEVAAFRAKHAGEIEAIVSHVLASDAILWDRSLRVDAPLPSLLGLRHIAPVLLLEALERNRAGDRAGALRALDACWRINADLRAAPLLLQHLIAMALDSMQFAALRRMGPLPEEWQRRVSEHDYRQALLTGLQGEAISFVEYGWRTERVRKQKEPPWDWLFRLVFFDLTLSSYSDVMRQMILRLGDADPCALDPAVFQKQVEASIPWWNIISKIAIPSFTRTWISSTNAALDAELTAGVLRARAVKAESGAWPHEAVASAVCEGTHWSHAISPEGTLMIALDRTFPASESFPKPFRLQAGSQDARVGRSLDEPSRADLSAEGRSRPSFPTSSRATPARGGTGRERARLAFASAARWP